MTVWYLSFLFLGFGLRELSPLTKALRNHFGQSQLVRQLRHSVLHLKLLQEMLESGMVPELELWQQVENFPAPFGLSLSRSLTELRQQGGAVLPTLLRMQKTLEEQTEIIYEGKIKSAQAFGQALLGLVLVPIFGLALYALLPELAQAKNEFFLLSLFAFLLSIVAWVWMISMVEQARFGNLRVENRSWLITVNLALERLLALIVTGAPPDLAWQKMMEELVLQDAVLAREWKSQIWDPDFSVQTSSPIDSERLVLQLGTELRRNIQTSLIEGRSCLDRIEALHRAFLLDLKMQIGRELALLPNRCLKPLFLLVLPSVMVLLIGSFMLSLQGFLPS